MSSGGNLSIFVPHAGCPHRCSFCDQHRISGAARPPTAGEVAALCNGYLPLDGAAEIAFFGGSFTAIEPAYMEDLLGAAKPFVDAGRAAGIRVSTRPDACDDVTLERLRAYGVTAIELGAQSMDDAVLAKNRRGHTAADVASAAKRIKRAGFSLGLQMMVGLYGERDARERAIYTARALAALQPDAVRIYPTVVLKNTPLSDLVKTGAYRPLSVEEAVDIVAELIPIFDLAGIRILRIGLHADEKLQQATVAGGYHPAMGERCYSRVFRNRLEVLLGPLETLLAAEVSVHPADISRAVGHRRENIAWFKARAAELRVRGDAELHRGCLRVDARITKV